jgi:hypothetical protein
MLCAALIPVLTVQSALDGMLLWRGLPEDIPPSLDDFLNVTEVEAVEAYDGAASVPPEFSGSDPD